MFGSQYFVLCSRDSHFSEVVVAFLSNFTSWHLLLLPSGVRYFMRGVDKEGHVANYVETEQILFYRNYKASFIQVVTLYHTNYCVCSV